MLRAALLFFVLGLVAILMGARNIGGLTLEVGQTLLGLFLIFAVISLIAGLISSQKASSSS